MAKPRRRSLKPRASTSPAEAAARTRAKASSTLVRPARSTAVRLEPTMRRLVSRSVTVAVVPTSFFTRAATARRWTPPVLTRNVSREESPVRAATYAALATTKLSLGAVGNSLTTPA